MKRTSYTFSVLQAIAATAALATIMWSLGLPSFRFVEAASVSSFSDTLSDSAPSVVSDHTIEFVATNGVAALESIVITFPAGFDLSSIDEGDVDLLEDGVPESVGGAWTVATTSTTITITSAGVASIAAGATTTVLVGLHATNDGSPDAQIVNPTAGSYEITVASGSQDDGATRVAIVDNVLVTAAVDTIFTFSVSGVGSGVLVNTADTTGGATTPTTIPFGELSDGVASTAAQELAVTTNAANGFVVTVTADSQLVSSNGADIDGFADGAFTSTPTAWASPTGTIGNENEYGHWGLSSDDPTLTVGLSDLYSGGDDFVSASTTPVEVFRHNLPSDGSGVGQGTTTVIYKAEITALQEAASDYQATLTYVATPVF